MNFNVWRLSFCQALMMTANILLVSSSALVGYALADNKALATIPFALQLIATLLAGVPASLFMGKAGRRMGFLTGSLFGIFGGVVATTAIVQSSFWLFCVGTVLTGIFNGFGNYFRFAAVDAVPENQANKAIAYVMAGGVIAAFVGPSLANGLRDAWLGVEFAASYASLVVIYTVAFATLFFVKIPRAYIQSIDSQNRNLWTIVRQPKFIVAVISGTLGYAVMSLIMTATPLSMRADAFMFGDTAFVIQWHVFFMFAPSFFTSFFIRRFGLMPVMFAGAVFELACAIINLSGNTFNHYWIALMLLGLGWNFLFVGATALVTETYRPGELAKTQAVNDFTIFTFVSLASLSAGVLQYRYGWYAVNSASLPLLLVVMGSIVWLARQTSSASVVDSVATK